MSGSKHPARQRKDKRAEIPAEARAVAKDGKQQKLDPMTSHRMFSQMLGERLVIVLKTGATVTGKLRWADGAHNMVVVGATVVLSDCSRHSYPLLLVKGASIRTVEPAGAAALEASVYRALLSQERWRQKRKERRASLGGTDHDEVDVPERAQA